LTPISRLGRAGAAIVCFGLMGVGGGHALDLNPFHTNAPVQTAQSTLPPAGIPGAAGDSVDAGDAGALDVRIDRLEGQLRQANGRIEELENQQRRLEDQIKRFQQDVEFRLGGAGAGAGASPVAAAPPIAAAPPAAPLAEAANPSRKGDAFDPGNNPNAIGSPRPLGSTPPSAPLDLAGSHATPPPAAATPVASLPTGPIPGAPLPADSGPNVVAGVVPSTGNGFTDGPRDQYNAAIEAFRNGQYAEAEEQLKGFLAANGGNRLAPDAIFYLGETYFQRSRPREAAEQYLKLSTDYSKSARAPEGMLRLGQSLAALGSSEQACATYAEVGKRYPTAAPAVKKMTEREMQKSHC
jgi:tol-pal system protein YbgF